MTLFITMLRDLFINRIAASVHMPRKMRKWIYNLYGMKVRTHSIYPGVYFGGNSVIIGTGTFISYGCFFDASAQLTIGSNCAIAMEVLVCTSSHELGPSGRRAGKATKEPVLIGDGCWIGARAIILPGVQIGNGCIIAAGAVVTKDCVPNGLYVGVPAKRVKELT